jgi:hypothetical protein
MTRREIYIAAIVAAIIIGAAVFREIGSNIAIGKLEKKIAVERSNAAELEKRADEKSREAEIYREKLTYLEGNLDEINQIARRQNEEIKKFEVVVGAARDDVRRARGVRSIAVTAAELCDKLGEAGHPCGE